MELVGDIGTFGHILLDGRVKISIFIHNESVLMDVLEDTMINWNKLWDEAKEREMENV